MDLGPGTLLTFDPTLADPVPEADRETVRAVLQGAKELVAEADAAEAEAARLHVPTAAEEAILQTRLEAALAGIVRETKQIVGTVQDANVKAGVSGLSGTYFAAIVPYLDIKPDPPVWRAKMAPGVQTMYGDTTGPEWLASRLAQDAEVINEEPEGTWVWADKEYPHSNETTTGNWRPVFTQFYACPQGDRWDTAGGWPNPWTHLLAAGELRVAAEYPQPVETLLGEGERYITAPGRTLGEPSGAPFLPAVASVYGGEEYKAVVATGRMIPNPNAGRALVWGIPETRLQVVGRKGYAPTETTSFETLRWLEAGSPEITACYQQNRAPAFKRFLGRTMKNVAPILTHPAVAAAIAVVTYGAGAALPYAFQGAAQALPRVPIAMAKMPTGTIMNMAAEEIVRGGVTIKIAHTGLTKPENLTRDLTRMIVSGVLVPGYGPLMAVVAPRQSNKVLQKLSAEAFFTVPGFSSLVAHAEWNRERRNRFRLLIAKRYTKLYDKYQIAQVILIVKNTLDVLSAVFIWLPPLALVLQGLSAAVSIWDAAMQAEALLFQLQAARIRLAEEVDAGLNEIGDQKRALQEEIERLRKLIASYDRGDDVTTVPEAVSPASKRSAGMLALAAAVLGAVVVGSGRA